MRELISILNEISVVDNGRLSGCRVWRNPSSRDLDVLASDRDLRGLVDGDDVYVWPAEMATHRMIPAQIGIEYHDALYPFYIQSDSYAFKDWQTRDQWSQGVPDFVVGTTEIYCNHDVYVVEDYLFSRGFCKMVGVEPLAYAAE